MRLQLRWLDQPKLGRVQVLTDEHGTVLPGQRQVAVRYSVDHPPVIAVEFAAKGEVTITDLHARPDSAADPDQDLPVLVPGVLVPGVIV